MSDNFDTHKWFKDQYLNEGDILDETAPNQEFLDIVREEIEKTSTEYNDLSVGGKYSSTLMSMEKPFYKSNDDLQKIIDLYGKHIRMLGGLMRDNKNK